MPARNLTVALPKGVVTKISDGAVSALSVTNLHPVHAVQLHATTADAAPAATVAPVVLRPHETITTDTTLAKLWPSLTPPLYVWAVAPAPLPIGVRHA